MRYKNAIFLFMWFCWGGQCSQSNSTEIDYQLNEIYKRFGEGALFNKIFVAPEFQSVIVLNESHSRILKGYEWRGQNWKETEEYKMEVRGTVSEYSFLFPINKKLKDTLVYYQDVFTKESGKIRSISIEALSNYQENKKVKITWQLDNKGENKAFYIYLIH